MPKTLLLDRTAWDLVLDANGDIALASEPYSIAQDVASAVRTFLGECWYDIEQGIPYWQKILGYWPAKAYIKSVIEKRALQVSGVAQAKCVLVSMTDRSLTGQIQVIDTSGNESGVTF